MMFSCTNPSMRCLLVLCIAQCFNGAEDHQTQLRPRTIKLGIILVAISSWFILILSNDLSLSVILSSSPSRPLSLPLRLSLSPSLFSTSTSTSTYITFSITFSILLLYHLLYHLLYQPSLFTFSISTPITFSISICICQYQLLLMRKHYFLIEKFLLFLFYLESMVIMEAEHKQYFWMVTMLVAIVSLTFEGARPYTPMFAVIFIADLLELGILQTTMVVIIGVLMVYLKFYHIQIVGKGPFNSGYRCHTYNNIMVGIFYPSISNGEHCKWVPTEKYSEDLYDIVFVDPTKPRLVPFFLFKFAMSFMSKIKMPVLGNASLYTEDGKESEKWKVVVFSHGLASNMTNYSSLCGWWASHGYLVVSIQHDHDTVRVDFDKKLLKELDVLEKLLYDKRNSDLQTRAEEFETILEQILTKGMLKQIFPEVKRTIEVESVFLAGQSYGGATVLETMAKMNMKKGASPLIKGLICMDAWFFPLSASTYLNLKDENILLLNSETFFKDVPHIYLMEDKMNRIRQANLSTMKAVMVKKTDHVSTSDFSFVLGNIMKIMQTVKLQEHTLSILEFHQIAISLFMEGKSTKEIIETGNDYAKENGLMSIGVYLEEEWRYQRDEPNKQA